MGVTQQVGLGNPEWGVASTFLDYDLDGNLDLFVVNYLAYHTGMPVTRFRGQIGYGHPRAYTENKKKKKKKKQQEKKKTREKNKKKKKTERQRTKTIKQRR